MFIAGCLTSFVGNWSYGLFFKTIRTYQLMVHLVMCRVIFPANLLIFLKTVRPVAQCDFLEDFFGWFNLKVPLSKKDEGNMFRFVNQMTELDYDSYNQVYTLSTVTIIILIVFIISVTRFLLEIYRLAKKRYNYLTGN